MLINLFGVQQDGSVDRGPSTKSKYLSLIPRNQMKEEEKRHMQIILQTWHMQHGMYTPIHIYKHTK